MRPLKSTLTLPCAVIVMLLSIVAVYVSLGIAEPPIMAESLAEDLSANRDEQAEIMRILESSLAKIALRCTVLMIAPILFVIAILLVVNRRQILTSLRHCVTRANAGSGQSDATHRAK